jgi:hypothetical protein
MCLFAIDLAKAALLGTDAVVAIDLDYSELSGPGKMLFLVASGTVVTLSKPQFRLNACSLNVPVRAKGIARASPLSVCEPDEEPAVAPCRRRRDDHHHAVHRLPP